jgi:hypothetical protein
MADRRRDEPARRRRRRENSVAAVAFAALCLGGIAIGELTRNAPGVVTPEAGIAISTEGPACPLSTVAEPAYVVTAQPGSDRLSLVDVASSDWTVAEEDDEPADDCDDFRSELRKGRQVILECRLGQIDAAPVRVTLLDQSFGFALGRVEQWRMRLRDGTDGVEIDANCLFDPADTFLTGDVVNVRFVDMVR